MDRPIRVLHLIDSLSMGGAERLLLGLAERIDQQRFEIHVCSLHVLRSNALQPEFDRLKLPLYVVGAKRLADPKAVMAVVRYVREHEIDIIHTHLLAADIVGRIVGRIAGRPVISTLHNVPYQYDRESWPRRTLARLTTRYLATKLIAVARCVQQGFVKEWRIPASRIATIHNAVPMEHYLSIPPGRPTAADGDVVITNIGRLSAAKAQHLLIEAAAIVLQQRPDARFMIVGQGDLERRLKDLAQERGIADRIVFTGLRHDIPAVLAESDIFVLSSTWEGLPLTAVEAMAAARPVVLTDVGGNSELVQNGVQGLIVPPNDVAALAEALLALVNDETRRLELGRAARLRVQHDFSMATFTAQHEALYSEIWQAYGARALTRRASA